MSSTRYTTTAVTLSPATAVQLVAANAARVALTIQVTGVNPATFGFSAAPVAGQGLSLDGATGATGQGGSRIWDGLDRIPSDSIWAISTLGTTIIVLEGFAGP